MTKEQKIDIIIEEYRERHEVISDDSFIMYEPILREILQKYIS